MSSAETELKGLKIASLGGDERTYRELLGRMSRLLRGYYKTRLARAVLGASDAEDLVQETLMALHARRTLQAHRLLQEDARFRCKRTGR